VAGIIVVERARVRSARATEFDSLAEF
jgi:hypothetical protein